MACISAQGAYRCMPRTDGSDEEPGTLHTMVTSVTLIGQAANVNALPPLPPATAAQTVDDKASAKTKQKILIGALVGGLLGLALSAVLVTTILVKRHRAQLEAKQADLSEAARHGVTGVPSGGSTINPVDTRSRVQVGNYAVVQQPLNEITIQKKPVPDAKQLYNVKTPGHEFDFVALREPQPQSQEPTADQKKRNERQPTTTPDSLSWTSFIIDQSQNANAPPRSDHGSGGLAADVIVGKDSSDHYNHAGDGSADSISRNVIIIRPDDDGDDRSSYEKR